MKNPTPKPPKNLTGKTIITPLGKIRPGRRKPFHKATRQVQDEIIDFVAKLLTRQASRYEIHKAVEAKFDLGWDQTDRTYIPRAKEQIRKATSISKDQAREIGLGVLLDVVKTEKGNVRVNAERRLSEIFGYNAPTRTELSGPDGGLIPLGHQKVESLPDSELTRIVREGLEKGFLKPEEVPAKLLASNGEKGNGAS